MHEQLWFTKLLNTYFADVANAVLGLFHIHAHNPEAPIPNYIAMQVLVVLILAVFFVMVRMRLSVEKPGALQHVAEGLYGFIEDQSKELIGHNYKPYASFLASLCVFIFTANMIGLIPSLESPTAFPSVPLGCAAVTWLFYHLHGIRKNGIGYLKHFMGPVLPLAWLMLPIEAASHAARVLSLTVRLYANMFAGEMVTMIFFSLIPIGVPVIFMGLHVLVGTIQTYIFVLLASVYIGEAVAHEH